MSLLKYLERLKRIDDLIRRKVTGSPNEFAIKLEISRSQLLNDLKELKELGAPISYSSTYRSYYYTQKCHFILDFAKVHQNPHNEEV
jgi:predicted DNA-binding transcriptional regulator YafY